MGSKSTSRGSDRGGETIPNEKIEAAKNKRILEKSFNEFIRTLSPFTRALFVILALTVLSVVFSYPHILWYVSVIGGILSILGVLMMSRDLINVGIMTTALIFYVSNLNLPFSLFNVFILVLAFILFYSGLMYINNLVKVMSVLKKTEERDNELLEDYRKKWNQSLFKNSFLSFLVALTAFLIAWLGSFNLGPETDIKVLFGGSLSFVIFAIILIYLLVIKLPEFHGSEG